MLITGEQNLVKTDTAAVNLLTVGDLTSFNWVESPLKYFRSSDHPDQQLCNVHYAALNFRDVMQASGKMQLSDRRGMWTRLYTYSYYYLADI